MTNRGHVAVGLDFGTSGLKVVALAENGSVVGHVRRGYPTSRPVAGAAEQSPQDWLDAAESALHHLSRTIEPARWTVIGLSAMLPTLVELDPHGLPIGPAVTWEDGRAADEGFRLRTRMGTERSYRVTGARLDGRYLLPMHQRWLSDAAGSAGATIAGAKDYLFYWLTGELITDPSTAAGYGCFDIHAGAWDDEFREMVGDVRLPDVVGSGQWRPLAADIAARLGCACIPVVLGAADSVLGAYGLGVTKPGRTAYITGTSNVILGYSDIAVLDARQRYLVTPMADGGYGLEMDLLATGAAISWLAALLGLTGGAEELVELAGDSQMETAPLFLPYLAPGEQGALWDSRLTGTLTGLSLYTRRADLARGLLAGIIVESRRCLDVLAEATPGGSHDEPIRLSGSSAASAVFRRDLADATGRPVAAFTAQPGHSALGAALFAARVTLGWEPVELEPTEYVEPDPARAALWTDRAGSHDAVRCALYPDPSGAPPSA